jgi:hypothetical protein
VASDAPRLTDRPVSPGSVLRRHTRGCFSNLRSALLCGAGSGALQQSQPPFATSLQGNRFLTYNLFFP